MARPSMYETPRKQRLVFYVDEGLENDLKALAEGSNRSLADYLYQVFRMHVEAVRQ